MKTLYSSIACLLVITVLLACNSSEGEESAELSTQAQSLPATFSAVKSTDTFKPVFINRPSIATTALNPAHGQPGHRCDIAVGAPLNSAPAVSKPIQMQQPAQTITPIQVNPNSSNITVNPPVAKQAAITKQASVTTAGMNPAHGQPNHRCDIAVGAPLNSAPTAKTTTPTVIQQQPVQTTPPVQANQISTGIGVKLNPPHGQPGHDCAVEVGKPLKQ